MLQTIQEREEKQASRTDTGISGIFRSDKETIYILRDMLSLAPASSREYWNHDMFGQQRKNRKNSVLGSCGYPWYFLEDTDSFQILRSLS